MSVVSLRGKNNQNRPKTSISATDTARVRVRLSVLVEQRDEKKPNVTNLVRSAQAIVRPFDSVDCIEFAQELGLESSQQRVCGRSYRGGIFGPIRYLQVSSEKLLCYSSGQLHLKP